MNNLEVNRLLIAAVAGIIPVAVVDFRAFSAARKADRTVTFDWALALSNWAVGALLSVATVAGFSLAVPQ